MAKTIVTSHLHGRIEKMFQEAKAKGLVISCDRITGTDNYLLQKTGSRPVQLTRIATAVILRELLLP